jgi:hypothetical protein
MNQRRSPSGSSPGFSPSKNRKCSPCDAQNRAASSRASRHLALAARRVPAEAQPRSLEKKLPQQARPQRALRFGAAQILFFPRREMIDHRRAL